MSSEQVAPPQVAETPTPAVAARAVVALVPTSSAAIIVFNIVALILVPPFPKGGSSG